MGPIPISQENGANPHFAAKMGIGPISMTTTENYRLPPPPHHRQTNPMARIPRKLLAGFCYHVINRGNRRETVFHTPGDYRAFLAIVAQAQQERPVPILAACLMPNHFHFVLMPARIRDMSRWFHWVMTTHVTRYHRAHGTSGRLWQGPYKLFPIQQDMYLLSVMRYVEANALRAGLVRRAEDWRWGSLHWRLRGRLPQEFIDPPSGLPERWTEKVNTLDRPGDLDKLRTSVNRQRPYGSRDWVKETARQMGLQSSMRTVGRPRRG